ncbi:hypothetical protein IAD21_05623 [Abditibacteriota bacterium]|nr:hypothetical protein IAD21_05623 [Abditibacteriota bacterium]
MQLSETKMRPATDADVEAIGELWWEMMEFHRSLLPVPLTTTEEASAQQQKYLLERLRDEDALVLVVEVDGRVAGYLRASVGQYPSLYEPHPYGSIAELCVSVEYRRLGLGEALFRAAGAWFKSRAVGHIEVTTMTANPVSNAFWEKMGFATFREVKQRRWED